VSSRPPVGRGTGAPSEVLRAHLAVVLAAISFGSTFIPVQDAIRRVGPVPFLGVRFLTGTVLLGGFLIRIGGWSRLGQPAILRGGLTAGVPLVIGYILQTIGLRYTTTPVSAFITYLLVVFVPVLGAVWTRRVPSREVMAGVVLAAVGLFLLTGAHLHLGLGELLTLGCALSFAVNILEIDRAVGANPAFQDVIALAVVQLATVAFGCLGPGLWLGGYRMPGSALAAAVYTGVACSALAFGLQVWGQRRVGPTRTALLLMIEPVTAALVGWAPGQPLGGLGLTGAGLILVGILVSEVVPLRH
jgi:drug/metabolite transporter (DMT)-like permease